MVNFSLEGKIALVTGATYGIVRSQLHTQKQALQSVSTISIRRRLIWEWLPTKRKASMLTDMCAM